VAVIVAPARGSLSDPLITPPILLVVTWAFIKKGKATAAIIKGKNFLISMGECF
jgi:hypothetical protein